MKHIFLTFALFFVCSISLIAQFADPAVTGANYSPNESNIGQNTALNISFANTGSTIVPERSIEITVSTAQCYYTADSTKSPSGTGAAFFNWTYLGSNVWRGINKSPIAAFAGGLITINVKANTVSPSFETTNINVQPVSNFSAFNDAPYNNNVQPKLKAVPTIVAPIANDDLAQTEFNTPVTIYPLSNDKVASECTVQKILIVQDSDNGTASVNGNSIIFTPKKGFKGTTTFKYQILSSCGNSNEATVTVDVVKSVDCNEKRNNTISKSCKDGNPIITGTVLEGYEYMWLSSTARCPNDASQAIQGATGVDYTLPSAVMQKTYFIRCARPIGCTGWESVTESNCIEITPDECSKVSPICEAVSVVNNGNGTISVLNIGTYTAAIQIFNSNWQPVYNKTHNSSRIIIPLNSGTHYVKVQLYNTNGAWEYICEKMFKLDVTAEEISSLNAQATILDIQAKAETNRAAIQWVNNTGFKNDYFVVEKLNNTTGLFEVLETVNSKFTKGLESYTTYDNNVTDGDNTYRIKLMMLDGQELNSSIKTVQYKDVYNVRVFPNPASDYFELDLKQYEGKNVTLYVYDLIGNLALTKTFEKVGTTPVHIDLENVTSGQLLIRVTASGRRDVMKKLIIQK